MKKSVTSHQKSEKSSPSDHQTPQNNMGFNTGDIAMMRQAVTNPGSLYPHAVVQLNRLRGNRFVSRLVQRRDELSGDSPAPLSQSETRYAADTSSVLTRSGRSFVQRDPLPDAAVDEKLQTFAQDFSSKFQSILHVFPADPQNQVSPETLQSLFTKTQRDKLSAFFTTNIIPDRLFNGDDIGKSTAQQRMLIAAHILAVGKYTPGSFEQRVHAKFCGHWARMVRHYAGATASNDLGLGVAGNFDHDGNIVLGQHDNKVKQTSSDLGHKRVYENDLPSVEGDGIGPLQGNHAGRAENTDKQLFREYGLTMAQLETLEPGDWLYYYNANASGTHSVIFSHWVDGTAKSIDGTEIQYRKAVVFSQGTPAGGGREHPAYLGNNYYEQEDMKVVPVTQIFRVSPEAVPAQTVNELFPDFTKAQQANDKLLKAILKKKGLPVNLAQVRKTLRGENNTLIASISGRLTPKQLEMLNEANNGDDVQIIIGLRQLLGGLAFNAELLQTKHDAHYEKKNAEYDAIHDEVEAKKKENEPLLAAINSTLSQYDTQVADLEKQRPTPDLEPLITALRDLEDGLLSREGTASALEGFQAAIGEVAKQRDNPNLQPILKALTILRDSLGPWNAPKGHPFRKEIRALNREIKRLRTLNNSGYRRINAEIKALQTPEIKKALKQRDKLMKESTKLEKEMPYGLAQAGSMTKQQAEVDMTGKLLDVFDQSDLETTYLTPRDQVQGEVVVSR